MIRKLALFCFLTSLFFRVFPANTHAVESVKSDMDDGRYKKIILVINQVRGDECCDQGSAEHLAQQINSLKENNLSGNFSVRYDALSNLAFNSLLVGLDKSQFEMGAFLEITPKLAADAGVRYKGDGSDWYKAQNVYTVGYEFEDRKKIIDTYMKKFHNIFGAYPRFSTAWIMDTDSVNYMHNEYGVSTHQITREQWGTDSYTMSGGPVHYPYFASKNWLFAKSFNKSVGITTGIDNGAENILVLRQTGADPLFNYGDSTNSFTTQPNDYAIGKRGFEYFKKLKDQFINQRHNSYGFLLLGLENSMVQEFQDEFSKQLESIKNDDEIISMKVSDFNNYADAHTQSVVGIEGDDFVSFSGKKSFWVNGTNYRARFLYKDNALYLSDLRLANEDLVDPYNQYVAKDLAFWVTPFIFNASQQYSLESFSVLSNKMSLKDKFLNKLRENYLPEFQTKNLEVKPSHNDSTSFFDGIKIAENIKEMLGFSRNQYDQLMLRYIDSEGEKQEILFHEEVFKTSFKIDPENIYLSRSDFILIDENRRGFEIFFTDDGETKSSLLASFDCVKDSCQLNPRQPSNNFFEKLKEDYYPYFFPEIVDRDIDNIKSVFYAHNKYAIVGKNPVRFVFIPKDEKGFATNYKDEPETIVVPEPDKITLHTKKANGTTFLDIKSSSTGKYKVKFLVGDLISKNENVYFAPDCKSDLAYCMLHPVESIWYLSSMFYTKLRDF